VLNAILIFLAILSGIAAMHYLWGLRSRHESVTEAEYSELDVLKLILKCDPGEDWTVHAGPERYEAHMKKYPTVTLGYELEGEDFHEPWANEHADSTAIRYEIELKYQNTLIQRFYCVSVDGGRALMPTPKLTTNRSFPDKIRRMDYKVAKVFDALNTLDEYVERSGLTVEPG